MKYFDDRAMKEVKSEKSRAFFTLKSVQIDEK